MHLRALRTVLLIQAIEETDRVGEVIPLADRTEASRSAIRILSRAGTAPDIAPQSEYSDRFLSERADSLLTKLAARAPAVVHVLHLAGGLTWITRALLILAFVSGVGMAALDGSRRINVLAFPLIGLLAWNVLVYIFLGVSWIRRSWAAPARARLSGSLFVAWIERRVTALLRQSMRFNVPLTNALRRFVREWSVVAQPMLALHAKRLLHIAAALLALGLIAGLYVRGVVLRYEAGWESTFLGPRTVHAIVHVLYGPAAALSGFEFPTLDAISRLRWTADGGGGEAALWIHLIAITAVLYIVLPRSLLALGASFGIWRFSRQPPVPATLRSYARALALSVGQGTVRETVGVTPYAYEPNDRSSEALTLLLTGALGSALQVRMRAPLRYGEDVTLSRLLAEPSASADAGAAHPERPSSTGLQADWIVLLMTLASTPEPDNHGAVIVAVRDELSRDAPTTPLLVIIDDGPYASRMRAEAALEQRLEDRRRLWREFVSGYGLRACIVNLLQITPGSPAESIAREDVRAALWTASETA